MKKSANVKIDLKTSCSPKNREVKKVRRMNKAREMWDIIKHMKRCIIGVPE